MPERSGVRALKKRVLSRRITLGVVCPEIVRGWKSSLPDSQIGSRIISGTFWSLCGSLASRALGLLAAILAARILGKHDFGEFGLVQATIATFGIFAGGGTSLTVTKHIAELRVCAPERAARVLKLSNVIAVISGGLISAVCFVLAPMLALHALASSEMVGLLRIAAPMLLLDSINGVQTGGLVGFAAFKAIARVNLVVGLLSCALTLLGAFWGGVQGVVWAQLGVSVLHCTLSYLALAKVTQLLGFSLKGEGILCEMPVVWSFSLPAMLGSAVTGPVGWTLNALLANQPGGYEQLGLYTAVSRIKQIPESLLVMLCAPVMPLLTEHFAKRDSQSYRKILRYSIALSSITIIPISLLQLAVPNLTLWPFGKSYAGHERLVQWMMLHAIAMGIFSPLSSVAISMHRMWFAWAMNVLFALLNIGIGIFFVPIYGVRGMVAATVISFTVANLVCARLTAGYEPKYFAGGSFVGALALATIMAAACMLAGLRAGGLFAVAVALLSCIAIVVADVSILERRDKEILPNEMVRALRFSIVGGSRSWVLLVKGGLRRRFPRLWRVLHETRKDVREHAYWKRRAQEVRECADNLRIPRVADAGRLQNGAQIMHNGLRVVPGSYYGKGGQRLLELNGGCHEPQEEFVFMQVLRHLRRGAVMIECGAYWGFYSMWFCSHVTNANAYLIEPDHENLEFGVKNFDLNGLKGEFVRALVGSENRSHANGLREVTLDDFSREWGINQCDILHADIQGAELDMLRGANALLEKHAVSFLFISTHNEKLHQDCQTFLAGKGYDTFVSIVPSQSFSVDGLIVARSNRYSEIMFTQPSKKNTQLLDLRRVR